MAVPRRRGLALASLSIAVVVVGLDTTVLNVALPTISTELQADTSQLQWMVDAYLLAVIAVMLPGGILGDRFGRRRVLLGGLAVFLIGSVCSAMSTSSSELIAGRAVQGLGAAAIVPLALALVVTTCPPEARARGIGILTAAVAAGLPLGPIIGGVLLQHFTWSSVFWINVPLVVVAALGCVLTVPESTNSHHVHFDPLGILLSTAASIALVYGMVGAPDVGWESPQTLILVPVSGLLIIAFLIRQRRARHPLVDPQIFREPRFTWACVAVMGATGVLLGVLFVVPQYLYGVRGDDALGVGLRTVPMMLGLLIGGSASSRLQRRWGPRRLISGAFGVLCVGLLGGAAVSTTTPYAVLGGALVVIGVGIGCAVAPAMDVATGAAGEERAGSASAVINTLRQLGGAISVAALGSLLSAVYVDNVAAAIAHLPAHLPARLEVVAANSLAGADGVANHLGAAGAGLRIAAAEAFSTAMMWVLVVCALLSGVCGLLVAAFMREGSIGRLPVVEDELVGGVR